MACLLVGACEGGEFNSSIVRIWSVKPIRANEAAAADELTKEEMFLAMASPGIVSYL